MSIILRSWSFSTLALASAFTLAADGPAPAAANVGTIPIYRSALSGYTPFADEKRSNWRDINDTAAVLGGHNAHLRDVERVVDALGTVLEVDPAAARVRIDTDAVKPLGWPAGIAFWQLADAALAAQVKPGQRIAFTLEKDGDVYRITGFARGAAPAPKPMQAADPHAGHRPGERK